MAEDDRGSLPVSERSEELQGQAAPRPGCLVVGMGASAGGLEAFEQFFTHMPPDSGIAFVLVQHLAPDHASLLPELLAKYTRMPVQQVTAETPVDARPRLRDPARCHPDDRGRRPARGVPAR